MLTGNVGGHLRKGVKFVLNHRGERHSIRRGYQFAALRHLTPFAAVSSEGMVLLVSTEDHVLGRLTYEQGSFDLDFMDAAMDLLLTEYGFSMAGRTFVDIGANIGTSAVAAVLRYGAGRVVAVEPEETNVRLLRANIALNGLTNCVDVHQVALSDRAGPGRLILCADNSGDHRVSAAPDGTSVSVTLTRLQDLPISEAGLYWIDVQGHEGHVLTGAGHMIDGVPIVTEFWPLVLQETGGLEPMLKVMRHRRVVDVRESMHRQSTAYVEPSEFDAMIHRLGRDWTDLLLLP
jgi:FkbM family methyltransferase